MPGKCKFSEEWLGLPEFKDWLKKGNDEHTAYCRWCSSSIDVSNMGRTALSSHSKSKKHMKGKATHGSTASMLDYVNTGTSSAPATQAGQINVSSEPAEELVPSTSATSQALASPSPSFTGSFDQNATTCAEAMWAMKTVMSHYSYHSCEKINELFRSMFPDSQVARNFTCGEKKCAYVLSFGLAPYFRKLLYESAKKNGSSNLQQKQLDMHIRMFDKDKKEVVTRYLDSSFMGHATADDLVQHFIDLTSHLPLKDLVQISMDGPTVNWSFYKKITTQLSHDQSHLIDIGSCGLHIVHGTCKYGSDATKWDLESFLSSIYRLFKDSPARREDFTTITGSDKFALKFCVHRWVENLPVAERARSLLPHIFKYVEKVQTDKTFTTPSSKTWETVKTMCKDILLESKLSFFISVAQQYTPFLTKYQADQPLLPYLSGDLEKLLRSLMARVVKPDVLRGADTVIKLLSVELNDETLLSFSKVDVGFSADKLVKTLYASGKISDRQAAEFRMDCRNWLQVSIPKLMNKNPLNYSLVRSCACFRPDRMATCPVTCAAQFKRLLVKLESCNRVSERNCDETQRQFQDFLDTVVVSNHRTFSSFSLDIERLDVFFCKYINAAQDRPLLWDVTRVVLTLSHGQATVERGFSINSSMVVENRSAESYSAQRTVHDHVTAVGGILNVEFTKPLLLSIKSARQKYGQDQKMKKRTQNETEQERKRKFHLTEISDVKDKRRRIDEDLKSLQESCDSFAEKADKTGKREWITKFSAMRKTMKEKEVEKDALEKEIRELEKRH